MFHIILSCYSFCTNGTRENSNNPATTQYLCNPFIPNLHVMKISLRCSHILRKEKSLITYWRACKTESQNKAKRKFNLLEEFFFIVLVRLRQGVNDEFLAVLCDTHKATFSCIFRTWIRFLCLDPSREVIEKWMPAQFRCYPKTKSIVDCADFFIEQPSSLNAQVTTYSSYKFHNTFKVIVRMSPNVL